ncbi:urea active transporter [Elsinoe australis]|uniref:Urea active transporter n=1 Tax=Elsinoe australis TaxID=40998 RepID=A0A4U7B952_9PEZI|nr:urea active transporter [Elsinoe australis]
MEPTGFQVLSPAFGYGIVIGIGGFFALMMLGLTYLQNRYTLYSTGQSEEFNTASRSVKPGLIAAGIVSSWTWSATLLTSSTFAYSYGIDGPMWYGGMGTFQILLFALIAIKIKSKAASAHTFPEIVLSRHGTAAHITYLWNGFATNLLVGACLNLGGSQVVGALTGMNVYAACFLIPLVVAAYVIVGGLRSTFIADYTHMVILFVAIMTFCFVMYATSDVVGGVDRFYDLLVEASERMPIEGNAGNGSYLTFRSTDGLVFAINLLVAGFSTVWLDQAYWQRAIASRPETSVKAYLLGGIAWYGIPFGFATCMGLGCAALTSDPRFPTFPNPLSKAEIGAGLSSPATAITLLGSGGAGLMLLLLFMAVTSSTSAELIAASSLITFDIYKTYIKPTASSQRLVKISHIGIIIYSLVLATFCCILNAVSINLTWLLTVLGIIVGGASVPVGLVLLWERMSTVATIASPYISLTLGLISWFVTTSKRSGEITVLSTGDVRNAVAGNITSWGSGALLAVVLTLLFPKKHSNHSVGADNASITGIAIVTPDGSASASPKENKRDEESVLQSADERTKDEPTSDPAPESMARTGNEMVDFLEAKQIQPLDPILVRKAERLAIGANWVFFFVAIIMVPFTLFGTGYVFNRAFFKGWVVMSFLWVWCSMIICVIWPIVESRGALWDIGRGVARDFRRLMRRESN